MSVLAIGNDKLSVQGRNRWVEAAYGTRFAYRPRGGSFCRRYLLASRRDCRRARAGTALEVRRAGIQAFFAAPLARQAVGRAGRIGPCRAVPVRGTRERVRLFQLRRVIQFAQLARTGRALLLLGGACRCAGGGFLGVRQGSHKAEKDDEQHGRFHGISLSLTKQTVNGHAREGGFAPFTSCLRPGKPILMRLPAAKAGCRPGYPTLSTGDRFSAFRRHSLRVRCADATASPSRNHRTRDRRPHGPGRSSLARAPPPGETRCPPHGVPQGAR